MKTLESLGNKICIIGCSSSGKSTLADKLSKQLNIPVHHLDLLAHYPNSKWERRSNDELITAHSEILKSDAWIIEGNYSICMPERFKEATAIIWLDANVIAAAYRYLKRCLKIGHDRVGILPGAQTEFRLWMVKHILFTYPQNRASYKQLLESYQDKTLYVSNMKKLNQYYRTWRIKLT